MSIAESVVAISIISIGLLGVSSLVLQSTKVRAINRNYLLAAMLSQEGLELTRNIRDQNWLDIVNDASGTLDASDWSRWLTDGSGHTTFTIDYMSDTTLANQPDQTVNSITDAGAQLSLSGDYYTHGIGTQTKYRRLISVVDSGDYLAASSTVSWNGGTYVAETYLYNWR